MSRNSLAVAVEGLSWMAYAGLSERTALFKAAGQLDITESTELRHAYRLIVETVRYQNRLDWILQAFDSGKRKRPHGVTSLLRILAYLSYVDHTRSSELVRYVSWGRQILGWKEIRPYEKIIASIVARKPRPSIGIEIDRLAIETCHPSWFVSRLIDTLGRSVALRILERDLRPLPQYARLNPLKASNDIRSKLARMGGLTEVPGLKEVWRFDSGTSRLLETGLISSGSIVVQDLASIVAGLVADAKPGETVFDMCGAPGNKTSLLAAQMANQGAIYSVDLSAKRLGRWREETKRTGCTIASAVNCDGRNIPLKVEADVVLLDPPCSNTGVFARSPSHKWAITPGRIAELTAMQYNLLLESSKHLRPGGSIVYCTCSILPEENEIVIENFIRKNPEFKLASQQPFLGSPGLRGLTACQRFFNYLHECNGYFIAKMEKSP